METYFSNNFATGWLTGFASGIIVSSNLIFPIVGGFLIGSYFGETLNIKETMINTMNTIACGGKC